MRRSWCAQLTGLLHERSAPRLRRDGQVRELLIQPARLSPTTFPSVLAYSASGRERHGAQTRFGDLDVALNARPIVAGVEPEYRVVDAAQSFRLHLQQCEFDVLERAGVRRLEFIAAGMFPIGPAIANATLEVECQFVTTFE
jgi:hypothetical protein